MSEAPLRVPTDIPGLDGMLEGGLLKGSNTLLVGGCGCGKSTVAMQYIYNGALKDEPGVYITFEEYPEAIRSNMSRYGWNLDELEKENKMAIMRIDPKDVMHVIKEDYGEIVDSINDLKAQRVVIDSISSIEVMIETVFERRENILRLCEWLRRHKCTSLITAEAEQSPLTYERHGILEFVVDAVIIQYNIRIGNQRQKALEILKMRGTQHAKSIAPFTFGKDGIEVFPHEQVFVDK
ncbi:RAD55 family ATPase [Candidatus Altiarchaeota archaeon]